MQDARAARLFASQEGERRAIARRLHDEVGQTLTAVSLNLRTLRSTPDDATRAELLDESIRITQQTLREVRELALDLRPSMLDDLGLGAALRWCLERYRSQLACAIALDDDIGETRYPTLIETMCFRIAQEAITNVARHGHAQHLRIVVHDDGGALVLVIEDDGTGFDVEGMLAQARRGDSFGLLAMEERAALVGGRLLIESRPNEGTRITGRFPRSA